MYQTQKPLLQSQITSVPKNTHTITQRHAIYLIIMKTVTRRNHSTKNSRQRMREYQNSKVANCTKDPLTAIASSDSYICSTLLNNYLQSVCGNTAITPLYHDYILQLNIYDSLGQRTALPLEKWQTYPPKRTKIIWSCNSLLKGALGKMSSCGNIAPRRNAKRLRTNSLEQRPSNEITTRITHCDLPRPSDWDVIFGVVKMEPYIYNSRRARSVAWLEELERENETMQRNAVQLDDSDDGVCCCPFRVHITWFKK